MFVSWLCGGFVEAVMLLLALRGGCPAVVTFATAHRAGDGFPPTLPFGHYPPPPLPSPSQTLQCHHLHLKGGW